MVAPGQEGVTHAAEGGGDAEDLVHVLVDELEALLHQVGDLEEGGGDKDRDDTGRLQTGLVGRVRMLRPAPGGGGGGGGLWWLWFW